MSAITERFVSLLEALWDTNRAFRTIVIILGTILLTLEFPGIIAAKVLPIRILGIMGGILLALMGTAIVVLGAWKGAGTATILTGVVSWLVGGYIWTHYESGKWRSQPFFFLKREGPWKELNILGGHVLVLYGLVFIWMWIARNDIWYLGEGLITIVLGAAIIDHSTYRPKPTASSKSSEKKRA